jgi:hypothetical protein
MGAVFKLLGFARLGCGCVVGRYREVPTNREVVYVEEKGMTCTNHWHRRNHTVSASRLKASGLAVVAKAS